MREVEVLRMDLRVIGQPHTLDLRTLCFNFAFKLIYLGFILALKFFYFLSCF